MSSRRSLRLALIAALLVLAGCGQPGPTSQSIPVEPSSSVAAAPSVPAETPAPATPAEPAPVLPEGYAVHTKITATYFYAGEPPSADNGYQTNEDSAWCSPWSHCFGGVDDPNNRNGDWPAGFKPKSNPFYGALPCSDFDENGLKADFKPHVSKIPWVADGSATVTEETSVLKDHWIAVSHGGKVVYVQWEDTGPFNEPNDNDCGYVFSHTDARPATTFGLHAGIDLSPAAAKRLGLDGSGLVSWWFVKQPPPGPWTDIITDAPPYWP